MGRATGAEAELDFQPLNDYLLLRPIPPDETTADATASHSAHAHASWGEVVAVGPCQRIVGAHPVSKGDRVAFRPASAVAIALAGRWFAVVGAADVLGIAGQPKELQEAAPVMAPSEPVPEVWSEQVASREESLETDVAPDLLDRSEPTADDLH